MYSMPQVTVYIREEDMSKWKAIEKKSEWMHFSLSKYRPIAKNDILPELPNSVIPLYILEEPNRTLIWGVNEYKNFTFEWNRVDAKPYYVHWQDREPTRKYTGVNLSTSELVKADLSVHKVTAPVPIPKAELDENGMGFVTSCKHGAAKGFCKHGECNK